MGTVHWSKTFKMAQFTSLVLASVLLVVSCGLATPTTGYQGDCIPTYQHGCQSASDSSQCIPLMGDGCSRNEDCCGPQDGSRGALHCSDGLCRPIIAADNECRPLGHDCQTAQDCCGSHTGSRHELTHWLATKDDCIKTYHTGCQTISDCCDEHMMCLHTAGQNSGMCRPWLTKENSACIPFMGH